MHGRKAARCVPKTEYRLFKKVLGIGLKGKVYFTAWQYYEV